MDEGYNERRDAWLKLYWEDAGRGEIKSREEYLVLFPELANAIDSLLAEVPESQDSGTAVTTMAGKGPLGRRGLKGKTLGQYQLIEEIGHGGQGFVYLAEDLKIRRQVALKILPQGQVFSRSARLRFEREAWTAGRLNHSGIARVIELGEHDGILFIAMELVKGKTLQECISESVAQANGDDRVTEAKIEFADNKNKIAVSSVNVDEGIITSVDYLAIIGVVRYIESAARALHVAHEAGLVHRDVKPGNLMVREDGSACVLDFGLAQDDMSSEATLTQAGDLMGTPAYMSPEQLLAHRVKLDRRTDVYSLGVCLFEATTLRRPFAGKSNQELYEAISQREPTAPRRLNPKIPRDLEAIILTAMEKSRERRYPTAVALAEDLCRFRSFEPVLARPAGPIVKSARWFQRNPVVAASSFVVFVSLLTAAIVFYVKGKEAGQALTAMEDALANYERLADVKRLERAIEAADLLYPPGPAMIEKLKDWQLNHGQIAVRLDGHRDFLAELRKAALPSSSQEVPTNAATGTAESGSSGTAIAKPFPRTRTGPDTVFPTGKSMADAGSALVLDGPEKRRKWIFEDQALQFQHDVLAELVTNLSDFVTQETGPVRSVAKRLKQSEMIAKETLEGEMARRWLDCQDRVKLNVKYPGLQLKPQLGLIPLGPDPDSGLEEFLHWVTHEGPLPVRDPTTGKISINEQLGIILVLIPGGTFTMGSQNDNSSLPNFDPNSQPGEQPIHQVTLLPYLLSKYEMTQAQWLRSFSESPFAYSTQFNGGHFRANISGRHPAERVSWDDAMRLLPRIDLLLPTEAEWERAARAGRLDCVFSECSEIEELRRFANLNGSETRSHGFTNQQPAHRDEHIVHAPVGSFLPNSYGLHDMTGNVWEWCLDCSARSYVESPGPRGLRHNPYSGRSHTIRGGSFNDPAAAARIAIRDTSTAEDRSHNLGIRPAQDLKN